MNHRTSLLILASIGLAVAAGSLWRSPSMRSTPKAGERREPESERAQLEAERSLKTPAALPAPPAPAAAAPGAPSRAPESEPVEGPNAMEHRLRSLGLKLAPVASLDGVTCDINACELMISHESSAVAGERVQQLLHDSMDYLPDSVFEPELEPGRTHITLSRSPDPVPRLPRPDVDPPRGLEESPPPRSQ